jgi:C4-dicarboxylate transporter
MSKKITLSIVLIAIIALAFVTWFFNNQISDLKNQISELQTQNSFLRNQTSKLEDQNSNLAKQLGDLQDEIRTIKVNITRFYVISRYNPIVGLLMGDHVRVTVQNVGANISGDAAGVILTVILMANSTTQLDGSWGFSKQVVTLHAGESQDIEGYLYYGINSYGTYVSTLTLGDFILDKWEGTHRVAW